MPRVARIVIPGVPHHITQRGNPPSAEQDVFFVDDDRRVYLELLAAQAERFGLKLLGYCLMDNHVHLVATPAAGGMAAQSRGHATGREPWADAFSVPAIGQPASRSQWPPLAEPLLLLRPGRRASVECAGLRGAQSRAGSGRAGSVELSVVERGGACR